MIQTASKTAMAFDIQIDGPRGSMNRNQNSDNATQITTEMNSRSNQFVSIGRKPDFSAIRSAVSEPSRCSDAKGGS